MANVNSIDSLSYDIGYQFVMEMISNTELDMFDDILKSIDLEIVRSGDADLIYQGMACAVTEARKERMQHGPII